jgi:hypothetical protein
MNRPLLLLLVANTSSRSHSAQRSCLFFSQEGQKLLPRQEKAKQDHVAGREPLAQAAIIVGRQASEPRMPIRM